MTKGGQNSKKSGGFGGSSAQGSSESMARGGQNYGEQKVVEEFDIREEAKRHGVLIASSVRGAARPPKRPGTELPR